MHVLPVDQIRARSADPRAHACPVDLRPMDFSRPFIPQRFTQLYYAPCYASLTREQRLRYNQLSALAVNEQFMGAERDFTNPLVARLARDRRVEPALRECLDGMMREEEAHLRMFLALNRHARPDLYADGESCFRRLGGGDRLALGLAMRASSRLPFLLFFVIALEELSAGLSRAMLKEREDPELGPLEENFVRVHGEHLKDEARHVHLDVHLIRAMYVGSWRLTRRINAALLAAFFENAMVPRRGGLAVLRRLFAERPELKPQAPAMEAQLLALGHDTAFHASLFSRELAPHTFALFDALPEMAALEGVLKSYARA